MLSSVLFQSILKRSAPLSTNAIRQLRKSPMDLDVYAWLAHRLYDLSRPSTVTWEQLSGQFGHGYTMLRKFQQFFSDSLQRVLKAYPEAKLRWPMSASCYCPRDRILNACPKSIRPCLLQQPLHLFRLNRICK